MKKLFFILTILYYGLFLQTALASDCNKYQINPKIKFSTSYGKLSYDYSKNQKEITELARQNNTLERGLFAAGLSTIQVAWEINLNTVAEIINKNQICIIPDSIEIFIGYQNPTIYLSNKLIPNTCHYNIVLRHEQTHQQINKVTLEHFIPHFYKASNELAKKLPIKEIKNISEINKATQELSYEYSQKIAPLIRFFKQQLLAEQSKLDNKDNYKHEADICH